MLVNTESLRRQPATALFHDQEQERLSYYGSILRALMTTFSTVKGFYSDRDQNQEIIPLKAKRPRPWFGDKYSMTRVKLFNFGLCTTPC